jgi:hypothetical protein
MNREQPPLSPEVRALLDHERELTPLPATVRARALARARAALVAGVDRPVAAVPLRHPHRWAVAAAVICLLGGAVGAAAYQFRAYISPAPAPEVRPAASPVKTIVAPPPVVAAPVAEVVEEAPAAPEPTAAKPMSRADATRAELRLLRQARAAVAREEYAAALPPIAEHARKFKGGRLSEEREALRVKALAGLGRSDEARRAAAAFRARFPRSVLLSAVNKMSPPER